MTMRSMWSGVVSCGMITIPMKMGRATTDDSMAMHQCHAEDGGRVRYRKVCETCGRELAQADIGKGAELATGETILLTEEDLESLPLATRKTAAIDYFCRADEIDEMSHDTSYFLWPGPGGEAAYRLMYEAMDDAGKVAVVRIAIRTREALAVVKPHNGALMLVTLFWPTEVREPEFTIDTVAEPPADQRKLAASLIDVLSRPFKPDEHHDRYSEAIRALVDGKRELVPAAGSGTASGLDLMAQLQAEGARVKAGKPAARKPRARAGAGAK